MAVDTRDKRGSALAFQQPAAWLFPNPDGAIDTQADRQFVGKIYSGIAVSALNVAEFISMQSAVIGGPYATSTTIAPKAAATMTVT